MSDYMVSIELPKQTLAVRAASSDDALFKAWAMIGLAGVQHYGHIAVVSPPLPAVPPVTR